MNLIIVFSIFLAVLRVVGVKAQWFQAVSHIWVGFLATSYGYTWKPVFAWTLLAISLVELTVFILDKKFKIYG